MSGRIEKIPSRKTRERLVLAAYTDHHGDTAEMPCSFCFKKNLVCKVADKSTKCSECIRRGRACDGSSVAATCEFSK